MYKRFLLLLVILFIPVFAHAESVTMACGQSLQIQPIIVGTISGSQCTVIPSSPTYSSFLVDFGPSGYHSGDWVDVGSNQPSINRTTQSTISYTMSCPTGNGPVYSNPVAATFLACGTQNYSCGSGGSACAACGGSGQPACAGGTYTSSNCNNTCAVATPKYSCSGSSCVRDDANGFTTDAACNNSCVVTPKYACSGTSCVRDDVNGVTTSTTCDNICVSGQASCSMTVTPSPGASSSPATINWTYNKNSGVGRADMYCKFTSPQNPAWLATTPFFSVASSPTANGTQATQALRLGTNVFNATCDTFGGNSNDINKALCTTSVTGNSISTCGNSIVESGEQCDNGAANGNSWPASCNTACQNITGPAGSSIIGFTSSYAPALTIAQGANTTLNWTTAGMVPGSCTVERSDTAGPSSWYTSSISPVAETNGSYALNGWAGRALPYYFRLKCTKSPSGTVYSNTAALTISAATCGDGIVGNTAGEECDDHNNTNGDGCSSTCKIESVCGNNVCEVAQGETCGTCSRDCGVCVDNSSCSADFTITPSHVLAGKPFTGSVTVRNIGTTDWTVGTYSFKSIDLTNWGIPKVDLPGQVSGLPTVGSNKFVMNATAPTTPGSYQFSWRMQKNSTVFGDICTPPGGITVYKPQCDDGLDNEPDGKIDCADPQCLNQSGICNKECDDETNGCGATQSLTATPPLVRNGASATLDWNIQNYVGTCSLVGPGLSLSVDPATKTTSTIINNITEKRTYYLTCGGLRSVATISVIKFVEARPGDISTTPAFQPPVDTIMYSCSGGKTGTACAEDPFGEYKTSDCDGMCGVVIDPGCPEGQICLPTY